MDAMRPQQVTELRETPPANGTRQLLPSATVIFRLRGQMAADGGLDRAPVVSRRDAFRVRQTGMPASRLLGPESLPTAGCRRLPSFRKRRLPWLGSLDTQGART
ncbi:hypothetical protein MRX96_007448 [Rhipicephalus microplus]